MPGAEPPVDRAGSAAAPAVRRRRADATNGRCGSGPIARSGPRRGRDLAGAAFHVAHQQVELAPEDAARLGIVNGETVQVAQNGTRLKATARRADRRAGRHGVPGRRDRDRLRQRADRAADRGSQAVIHLADVNYFEPWWIQIVKSLVIFLVRVRDPADADRLRAQVARPLPGPLRPQPRRAVRVAAADGRDRQVRHQGAFAADHVGRLPVPDRPGDRDPDRDRRRSR